MPDHVSCPRCGCACRVQPHDHAHCVQCFTSFRPSQVGPRLPYSCPQCGQMSDVQGHCDTCRDLARAPQGEAVRLFTPAPAQLPGQLNL
jgi:hypothetical protein